MGYIERTALVSYSAEQMFALVSDINSYPEYMSGCADAQILEQGEDWLKARLDLAKGGFKQSLVTRNTLVYPHTINMELVSGPFKKFNGRWDFTSLSEGACKVSLVLDYEFSTRIFGAMMKKLFETVASEQVHCLCDRAKRIYS